MVGNEGSASGGVCLDLNNDPLARGACTTVCPDGEIYQEGTCVAPA